VCISDYAVSSYTPSLSALVKARKNFSRVPRTKIEALLVAEPNAPELRPLPNAGSEIKAVAQLMVTSQLSKVTAVGGKEEAKSSATMPSIETVLEALPSAHFFHLACHGSQRKDPLHSGFALHDGSLTVETLMKLNTPNALLAFLSACESARGDKSQPDQAVHLAASMLFCGFRSIIATMW
jgi:CHAT domain-containing protein